MKYLFFCFVLVIKTEAILFSQEARDTVYIKPGQYMLEEMVISASRWEQNPDEMAARITQIEPQDIRIQNPQTAADLLAVSGGVYIQKSQLAGGSPMIRGFATNRVLLVLDGVRLNNAIFRSGNVQNVISVDANAIQNAEVIFGPGSVIYGSDAIGGVMDFHTISPRVSNSKKTLAEGNVLARYSSANGEQTYHGDVRIGFRRWAFLSSVSHSAYQNLRMGARGPTGYTRPNYVQRVDNEDIQAKNTDTDVQKPSGYRQFNVMQKILFAPQPDVHVTYSFHHSETGRFARYDRLILRDSDGILANAEWNYGPQKWTMHNVTIDFRKPNGIFDGVKLIAAYQDYGESRHTRSFGNEKRNNRFERVKAFSVNLDAEKKISEKSHLFYGADFVTNKVLSTAFQEDINNREVKPIATRYPNGALWTTFAGYASIRTKLRENWILNTSARYTIVVTRAHFDRTFFPLPVDKTKLTSGAVIGSAGIAFNSAGGIKWYTNLSTGFRAPNIDDIGKVFDSSPGLVVVPNPGLKPEYAYNAETGVSLRLRKNIRFEFTTYYTYLDNALQRGSYIYNGNTVIEYDGVASKVQALQNISSIQVYGIQTGFTINFPHGFEISSTANFQSGMEKDIQTGKLYRPSHVAPFFGSTYFRYAYKKVSAEFYGIYNGGVRFQNMPLTERADSFLYLQDNNGNPYVPSWLTINVKSAVTLNDHLTILAGIENIFDRRYRPFASGITSPGRNFIFALRAGF